MTVKDLIKYKIKSHYHGDRQFSFYFTDSTGNWYTLDKDPDNTKHGHYSRVIFSFKFKKYIRHRDFIENAL